MNFICLGKLSIKAQKLYKTHIILLLHVFCYDSMQKLRNRRNLWLFSIFIWIPSKHYMLRKCYDCVPRATYFLICNVFVKKAMRLLIFSDLRWLIYICDILEEFPTKRTNVDIFDGCVDNDVTTTDEHQQTPKGSRLQKQLPVEKHIRAQWAQTSKDPRLFEQWCLLRGPSRLTFKVTLWSALSRRLAVWLPAWPMEWPRRFGRSWEAWGVGWGLRSGGYSLGSYRLKSTTRRGSSLGGYCLGGYRWLQLRGYNLGGYSLGNSNLGY